MNDFKIVEKSLGNTLEIEEKAPIMKMSKIMGNDFVELMNYSERKFGDFIDAPYSRYVDIDWENEVTDKIWGKVKHLGDKLTKKMHFYCGIATLKEVEDNGHILNRHFDTQKYLKGIYHGSYKGVEKTYIEMYKYIKEHNLKAMPEVLEFYTNDPREVKEEELETVILIPIN